MYPIQCTPMKPRLILGSREFEVTSTGLTLGRDTSNSIPIEDDSVSAFHCRVEMNPDCFVLVDCDSLNGTYVNGRAVSMASLQNGDEIRIGRTRLRFVVGEEPDGSEPNAIRIEEGEQADAQTTVVLDPAASVFMNAGGIRSKHERMIQDMSVLLKFSGEINEVDDSNELQKLVLKRLFEIVPADDAAIIPVSMRNAVVMGSVVSHQRFHHNEPVCVSKSILNVVLESGQSLLRNHLLDDRSSPQSIFRGRVSSVLCVPLSVRSNRIGVLYLNITSPGKQFDQRHLELVTAMAAITSVALEHLRYVEWLEHENEQLQHEAAIRHDMVGQSPKILEAVEKISRLAPNDSRVLILGETGTGKELAARAIHQNSPRRNGPFLAVNCAGIPETLFESELFGHVKGAFHNAERDRKGYIEEADGGTLFLDEIGDLPLNVQPKLLRVLEDRKVFRLGSTQPRVVDVRLISATSRPVTNESNDRFRKDLLIRLGIQLIMPPLRERLEDIPLLVRFFLEKHRHLAQHELGATPPETIQVLQEFHWPGNVRELDNAIQHAVLFGKHDRIRPEDLPDYIGNRAISPPKFLGKLDAGKQSYERQLILRALEETRGNVTEAAALLDRVPTYLQRRISQLRLRDELNRIRRG